MEIKIQKIIYPGKSLGLSNNKTILTDEGIPGETVEITPLEEKKSHIEAKTVKIITPSSARITPRCSHYRSCGPYQYIDYKTQLALKESQLKEIFPNTPITVIPSPEIWRYRNKIKLSVIWGDGKASLAYHIPESRDKFIRIDSCNLVSENVNKFLASFIDTVNKENLGSIKEIEVRESYSTKKIIFTSHQKAPGIKPEMNEAGSGFAGADPAVKDATAVLRQAQDGSKDGERPSTSLRTLEVPSVIEGRSRTIKPWSFTTQPLIKIEKFQNISYIEEKVSGKTFRIGPGSFFQVNVPMLELALEEMKKSMVLNKKEILADFYCGIGTFGIALSQFAEKVIGIESESANISFLKSNLKLNKIENFKLYEGSCEKLFPALLNSGITTLILDPPRKGLENMLCQNILLSSIKNILYLSCNPSTLNRDLKILSRSYTTRALHLFDFFPQTPHIETLAILEMRQ